MLSKITQSLAVLAAASVFLAGTALAEPISIKFSHVVAQDTPKGLAAEFFKKRAEELTQGKVKVEVYPNSQLYKDKEEMEALQLGAVQMLAPSLAKFGPLGVKEFEVFDLPFIFIDLDALRKVTNGAVGKQLLAKLEPKGIRGLGYWDNGFNNQGSNGNYWSSSQVSSANARYLIFNSTYVVPANYGYKDNGFPVRCVAL